MQTSYTIRFLLTLTFVFSSAAANAQTWLDTGEMADWGDHDRTGGPPGSWPLASECRTNTLGQLAVCWQSDNNCVYKTVTLDTASDGGHPGRVFVCSAPQGNTLILPETWEAWEGGGFLTKSWKELGSQEAKTLIILGCAGFGVNCASEAEAIRKWAQITRNYVSTGNVFTSARIVSHPGEEYHAYFDSPNGYTICKARVDVKNGSITGPSTFNAGIKRDGGVDGLGVYSVVPQKAFRTVGAFQSSDSLCSRWAA
jgi:hypothetical protein